MSTSSITEWSLDDITERDILISNMLTTLIKAWNDRYTVDQTAVPDEPSDEQKALIDQFKKNGWVK
jgi:hypothetical protein